MCPTGPNTSKILLLADAGQHDFLKRWKCFGSGQRPIRVVVARSFALQEGFQAQFLSASVTFVKAQARLLEMLKKPQHMTRGHLVSFRAARKAAGSIISSTAGTRNCSRDAFPLSEIVSYEKSTEKFREFMYVVDAYVDEISPKGMAKIRKEAKVTRDKGGKARRADGRLQSGRARK